MTYFWNLLKNIGSVCYFIFPYDLQGVPKKWSISFLAIKCVFINVKLKVWYVLASYDQILILYEKIGPQYLQIFAIFAYIGLFFNVKSKV